MIQFENVNLYSKDGSEILRDIQLHTPHGSFQILTGPVSSGKTSLLKLIFLSLKPSNGSIYISGRNILHFTPKQRAVLRQYTKLISQELHLLPHFTVYENIALSLYIQNQKEINYRSEILELLKWIGLQEKINSYPEDLSTGEKQLLAISRAVISRPKILLIDDPAKYVDEIILKKLLHLFLELNHAGTTIILTVQNTAFYDNISAQRFILKNKQLFILD